MKAATLSAYGSVSNLVVKEVNTPEPRHDEVRVKIHASTVTAGDCELRALDLPTMFTIPLRVLMFFKNKHKILGQEYAGVVDAIGAEVSGFNVGDRVFGAADATFACHAEYKCFKESHLITKIPEQLSFSEAATISTGGLNALHFLDKAQLKKDQKILIVGAGGSIGTCAVQIAKAQGAHVTSVDESSKLEMLKAIGSDAVIDYNAEDAYGRIGEFDVVLDIANKMLPKSALQPLKPKGLYIMTNISVKIGWQLYRSAKPDGKRMIIALASYNADLMNAVMDYVNRGIIKPVIDRTFKLDEIAKAHTYVDTGKKAGHVVIEM